MLIIDVRDDDFEGIKIKGAVNVPSAEFADFDFVDEKLRSWRQYDTLIFHCMLSQVRGPRIADLVSRRLQMLQEEEGGEETRTPEVKVLVHGWTVCFFLSFFLSVNIDMYVYFYMNVYVNIHRDGSVTLETMKNW